MSLLEWLKFWSKFFQNTPYSEVQFQNTPSPENENCQRVQIQEFQNTPPPRKWKLSESPNLSFRIRIPPKIENCQRVQIREFQNTPPKIKIVREFKSKSFRIPTPPQIGKTSDFKLQNSLKIREIYVETNLYPPGIPLVSICAVSSAKIIMTSWFSQ